jgi:hypothetical protein
MLKRLFLPLAAALIAASPPPPAAPRQGSIEDVNAKLVAFGAWAKQITDALTLANDAFAGLGPRMKALMPTSRDPAQVRAAAPRLRALLEEVRQPVLRSQAMLSAIPPLDPKIAALSALEPGRMLTDARAQIARILGYLDDCRTVADAIERGDVDVLRVAAPKLMRSGFLLIDTQVALFRGRQAMMPPSRSSYQATGVTIALYRTMSAAAGGWYEARVEGRAEEGAAVQRTRFLALAGELDALTRTGRAHLAAEGAELDAEQRAHRGGDQGRQLLERLRGLLALEEKYFRGGRRARRLGPIACRHVRRGARRAGPARASPGPHRLRAPARRDHRRGRGSDGAARRLSDPSAAPGRPCSAASGRRGWRGRGCRC